MEIYFIRHTAPLIEKGICYGQSDVTLAASFEQERAQLNAQLPDSFDAVYSSPLMRCERLASTMTERPLTLDDRLKEVDFGDWEMQSWNDIPQPELDIWMKDFVNVSPPNGESMLDLQRRVLSWWKEVEQLSFERVAVVTHAGVIRVLHAHFENIPLDKSFGKFRIDCGGVLIYRASESKII
jgi:alpha-ribazole phosphatase